MFKKFNPKDDVSGSTSLKSSVQRNIRNALLSQLPLLAQPAYRESSSSATAPAPGVGAEAVPEDADAAEPKAGAANGDDEDDGEVEGKSGGKKKGGKGKGKGEGKGKGGGKKGGKGKKDKGDDDEGEDGAGGAEEQGEVTVLDDIWPKKEALGLTKCHDRISIYTLAGEPLFFNHFDGPYIPTLKLLHKYPVMLPHVQIDRGAIKFLLAGANMMAPGLLSPGGKLPDSLAKDDIVAIHAEGKEHACGIGKMLGSSEEIRKAAKGPAVEVLCWIGDDLWAIDSIGV